MSDDQQADGPTGKQLKKNRPGQATANPFTLIISKQLPNAATLT
jgi:hypothetical protein